MITRRLEQIAMAIAVLCIVLIMFIVSYDAIARYALHAPLPWAFESVTYYLMIAAIYGALSGTFTQGDHVSITLFQDMLPERPRAIIEGVCSLLTAFVFALIVYGSSEAVIEAYVEHEFLPGYITWPAWLSQLPVPVGCALIALRLLHHGITLLLHGKDPSVAAFHEAVE